MGPSPSKTCALCSAEAKIFATLVKDGKATTIAWCAMHAAEAGAFDPLSYSLLESVTPTERRRSESTLRCPACDCSQRDFERQGRFGCPACYTAFAGVLPQLLRRMHRDVEHRGKIPQRHADPAVVRHRLAVLQAELNDAVRAQRFEWAAQTRDAIALLKAKLPDTLASAPAPLLPRPLPDQPLSE